MDRRDETYRDDGPIRGQPQQWGSGVGQAWPPADDYAQPRSSGRIDDRATEDDVARTPGSTHAVRPGGPYGGGRRYGGFGPAMAGSPGFGTFSGQFGGADFSAPEAPGAVGYHNPAREPSNGWSDHAEAHGYAGAPAPGYYPDARHHPVDHSGVGPANYTRSDERMLEDACERLTHNPRVDASNITVSVQEGEITLDGTVDSRPTKRMAEDCVDRVAGNLHVQNNLRVATSEAIPQGDMASDQARAGSYGK